MSFAVDVTVLHSSHPLIRAIDWRSPLVRRLLGSDNYADGSSTMEASFRATAGASPASETTTFKWNGLNTDFAQVVKTYQAPEITEKATLAVACALVTKYTGLQITEVTRRGQRADFWLGDKQMMLEVSGQQNGDLDVLCTSKSIQLLANPFGKDGYVCVANYHNAEIRLWFYC